MAPLTATPTNYSNLISGKLSAPITASQTASITVTMDTVQIGSRTAAPVTMPTGIMLLKLSRKTRTKTIVEYIGVDAGSTQSGSTATLATATRDVPSDDGSSFTGGGSGASWPSGTTVEMVWCVQHAENTMFKNNDNTIATGKKLYLGDGVNYITGTSGGDITLASNTTAAKTLAQLAAAAGSDEKVKITATDTTQQYLDDALLVTSPITKTTNNGGANETLTIALDTVPVTKGGTGLTTATTAYAPIFAGTTATGAFQAGTAGTSGQLLKSNGAAALPTFQDATFFGYSKNVFQSITAATQVGASQNDAVLDTHTYTIPANDLATGVWYTYEIAGTTAGTNAITIKIALGSSAVSSVAITPVGSGDFTFRAVVQGNAAAGASVTVSGSCEFRQALLGNVDYNSSGGFATNGTLALQCLISTGAGCTFDSKRCTITKHSTTAFT